MVDSRAGCFSGLNGGYEKKGKICTRIVGVVFGRSVDIPQKHMIRVRGFFPA
jgi:hypothetical protein